MRHSHLVSLGSLAVTISRAFSQLQLSIHSSPYPALTSPCQLPLLSCSYPWFSFIKIMNSGDWMYPELLAGVVNTLSISSQTHSSLCVGALTDDAAIPKEPPMERHPDSHSPFALWVVGHLPLLLCLQPIIPIAKATTLELAQGYKPFLMLSLSLIPF